MLDHVLDLLLHGDHEEHDEVQQQHRPEHGDVEEREEGGEDGQQERPGEGEPELELRHLSHEGPELVVLPHGQRAALHLWTQVVLGVHLRREEADEEVEGVDGHGVADDVEARDPPDPQDVEQDDAQREQPAMERVRGTHV